MRNTIPEILSLLCTIFFLFGGCDKQNPNEPEARPIDFEVGYTVTNGFRTRTSVQMYPSVSVFVTGELPERCTARIYMGEGEYTEKEIRPQNRVHFSFDDGGFNNVGTYNLSISIISPTGETLHLQDNVLVSMESTPHTGVLLTVTPEDSESSIYAEGESILVKSGSSGQFYVSVLPLEAATHVSLNTLSDFNTPFIIVPESGTESFNGTLTVPYTIAQKGSGTIQVRIMDNNTSTDYNFRIKTKEEIVPPDEPIITVSDFNDVIFSPVTAVIKGQVLNYDASRYTLSVRVDDMPSDGKIDGYGDFEIYVPTEDMTFGRHLVSVELVETDSQRTVACKYITFDLLDFVLKLVDQATGEESWNLFARVGLGKKYILKLQTGAEVPLNATLKNNLNGKTVAGNASSDGKDYSFTLTDDILVSGQQDLVILLSKQDREVAHVGITLIGLNSFVCKYSIEGDSVYATFSGNGSSFPFDTYHSISVYLIGVIPYTEAGGSPSQHHDIECFEEKDIDAVGMHFIMSQNETFIKKKIYTSSYFKYLSSYLNEQLGKIKAAHSSTRWKKTGNSWQKETYWPVPYIRMEFYLDERRVDGMPFDDYFDLSYETALVESFLSQYGVQTQVFH